MKNKKIIIFTVMFMSILALSNTRTFASENLEDEKAIESRGPICIPQKYYNSSSSKKDYTMNQRGEFRNAGYQVQSKTINYTTVYSSTISSSINAELELIAAKVNVGLQVSAGESTSVSLTSTFNVSPRSVGHYIVGQSRMKTSGYIVSVNDNCSTNQKYVTSNYSIGPYDSYQESSI